MQNLSKATFLEKSSALYDELTSQLDSNQIDFYEYEKRLESIMLGFTQQILEEGLSDTQVSAHKKKNVQTRFGRICIAKKHDYSASINGFHISPYLQERYVLAGQSDVYAACNDLITNLLCIPTNAMQVHRVTNFYGEQSAEIVTSTGLTSPPMSVASQEVVYAQLDGSMLLTRESDWQEAKLGRIFKATAIVPTATTPTVISESLYVSHLGTHTDFCAKFAKIVTPYAPLQARLIFLTDGAVWIKNWVQAQYPDATLILDYFHAAEYLHKWVESTFKDKVQRDIACAECKKILLEQGIQPLITHLEATLIAHPTESETKTVAQQKILNYFIYNAFRMDYPTYRANGWCIGSGAIEAAHRTVIQKRMKLSGQRWTKLNAQNMLNLRTANLSGKWHKVVALIRNHKPNAA